MLRWLRSPRPQNSDIRPFGRMQNRASQVRAARLWAQLLCYCLRMVAIEQQELGQQEHSRSARTPYFQPSCLISQDCCMARRKKQLRSYGYLSRLLATTAVALAQRSSRFRELAQGVVAKAERLIWEEQLWMSEHEHRPTTRLAEIQDDVSIRCRGKFRPSSAVSIFGALESGFFLSGKTAHKQPVNYRPPTPKPNNKNQELESSKEDESGPPTPPGAQPSTSGASKRRRHRGTNGKRMEVSPK
ncbi:hypothetical protein yc1106_04572 [Curvularia clavata]|uniref:Uncharacterized protein n=1 Tax=Curvularia clavata TaxID=95742 RepID=A0A9Q8ZBJ4_CURCL|nr:hypothetical protein yc1106_04572 [Curvularia clavata]